MLEPSSSQRHRLVMEAREGSTHAACSCGAWERDADADTLAVTGRSREDALRSAHELHAREIPSH